MNKKDSFVACYPLETLEQVPEAFGDLTLGRDVVESISALPKPLMRAHIVSRSRMVQINAHNLLVDVVINAFKERINHFEAAQNGQRKLAKVARFKQLVCAQSN